MRLITANVVLVFLLALYAGPASAEALGGSNYCSEIHRMPFNHVGEFRAYALARENRYGDLLSAMEKVAGSQSGIADLVYRIAPQNHDRSVDDSLLARLSDAPTEVDVLEIRTEGFFELHVTLVGEQRVTWIAGVDRSGCGLPTVRRDKSSVEFAVPARGIGTYVPEDPARTLEDALFAFEERPLVPAAQDDFMLPGDQTQAFICLAGGPGSLSCSWSPGTLGPIGAGSCSVECMPHFGYACCGPGIPYCECKPHGGGGGGGGLPPWWPPFFPPPCDSDCDDDDDQEDPKGMNG